MPKWETVSRSMFLVIPGRFQNAMAACAISTVKTTVSERFHFCHIFTNLVSQGIVLGVIFVYFGSLGDTFSDS